MFSVDFSNFIELTLHMVLIFCSFVHANLVNYFVRIFLTFYVLSIDTVSLLGCF